MQDVLTILASTFLVGAYLFYIWAMLKGEIPHPVTIGVWVVWVLLNVLTYESVASRLALVFAVVQRACMFVIATLVVIAIARRGWVKVKQQTTFNRWDIIMGVAVLCAFAYKFTVNDPRTSNAVAQAALLLSFVPMVKMAFKHTQRMSPWPWSLAVLAYGCQFALAYPDGIAALVYPIVGIVGHGVVWIGIRRLV